MSELLHSRRLIGQSGLRIIIENAVVIGTVLPRVSDMGHLYTCVIIAAAVNIVVGNADEVQAEIDRLLSRIQTARNSLVAFSVRVKNRIPG